MDTRLLGNAAANFGARVLLALLNLVLVPVYVRALGAETFGLIAFIASIQAIVGILDFGLTSMTSREIARAASPAERHAIARTSVVIYWILAGVVLLVFAGSAWPLARFWINRGSLSVETAAIAIGLAGCGVAFRWPISIYAGILQGLERQVAANAGLVAAMTIRVLGSIVVIKWYAPSVIAVLAWQVVSSIIEVGILRSIAYARLDCGGAPGGYSAEIFRRIWRLSIGFSAVGIVGTLGSNIDRILMGRFLPLQELGRYAVASSVTGVLTVIGIAASSAAFPRLARASGSAEARSATLATEISSALRLVSWAVVPSAFTIAFFGEAMLTIWVGSATDAHLTQPILILLACAATLNALANPFYSMLVADGQSRWLLMVNGAILVLLLPTYLFLLPRWGAAAAATGAILQNVLILGTSMWKCREAVFLGRMFGWRSARILCIFAVFFAAGYFSPFENTIGQVVTGMALCLLTLALTVSELGKTKAL